MAYCTALLLPTLFIGLLILFPLLMLFGQLLGEWFLGQ